MYDKRYITTAGKMQAKHEEYSIADLKRAPDMAALRAANAERDKANAARAASAAAQPHTSTDTEMDDDSMPPPPAPARNAAASSSGSGNSSSGGMGARSHTTPAPGPAAKRAEEERQRRLQMAAQKKAELQAAAAARKNEEAAAAAAAASAQQQRPTTAQMLDEVDEHTLHGALDYVEDEGMFGSQDLAADSGESEAAAMALEMQMEEEARMRALHGPQFRRATTASTPVVINAASSSRTASGETTEADDSGIGLDDETASALRVKQEYVESRAREKAAMPPPKRAGSKGRFSAPAPPVSTSRTPWLSTAHALSLERRLVTLRCRLTSRRQSGRALLAASRLDDGAVACAGSDGARRRPTRPGIRAGQTRGTRLRRHARRQARRGRGASTAAGQPADRRAWRDEASSRLSRVRTYHTLSLFTTRRHITACTITLPLGIR
jgi:hypothetical protein